jgi:hypothetical protein
MLAHHYPLLNASIGRTILHIVSDITSNAAGFLRRPWGKGDIATVGLTACSWIARGEKILR